MLRNRDIYDWIDSFAPFATQEPYDNAGLLVGDPEAEVRGVYCALDVTAQVLDEAEAAGASLIVTHHPMLFGGRSTLAERPQDAEAMLLCRMIRSRTALIAAHTNLDQAPGGINEVLADVLGLRDVRGEGFIRRGILPGDINGETFTHLVEERLRTPVRVYGNPQAKVRRVAVCSGAGSEEWLSAWEEEPIDAFVTGEMRHHHGLAMAGAGVLGVEAGHYATEAPGIFALAEALQKHLDGLQCQVRVTHPAG